MNLQAGKLEVVRLILDADDKTNLGEVKALFKNRRKPTNKDADLGEFYQGFRDGILEVKALIDGKTVLQDAKTWLNELQD